MSTEAERTRVLCRILDRFHGQGPRAGNEHCYSKLECGHLIDHGATYRIDRPLPDVGSTVCCRKCTNAARGR